LAILALASATLLGSPALASDYPQCLWDKIPNAWRSAIQTSEWDELIRNKLFLDRCALYEAMLECGVPLQSEVGRPMGRAFADFAMREHAESWLLKHANLSRERLDRAWREMGPAWQSKFAAALKTKDDAVMRVSIAMFLDRLDVEDVSEQGRMEVGIYLTKRIEGPNTSAEASKQVQRFAQFAPRPIEPGEFNGVYIPEPPPTGCPG
jgi:hypothetical protein